MEAKSLRMEGEDHIILSSQSGSITLDAGQVVLDPLALPEGGLGGPRGYPGEENQYKLCICSPSGKLFSVPTQISGSKAVTTCDTMLPSWTTHPCETDLD